MKSRKSFQNHFSAYVQRVLFHKKSLTSESRDPLPNFSLCHEAVTMHFISDTNMPFTSERQKEGKSGSDFKEKIRSLESITVGY